MYAVYIVHTICSLLYTVYVCTVYTLYIQYVRSMHCLQAHTMYNIKMYVNEMEHMKCESYQQHLRKAFYTNSCISGRAACMGSS